LIPDVSSFLLIPGAVSAIGWTAGSNVILQDFSDVSTLFQDHPVSQPTSASFLHFSFASFLVLGHTDDIKESQAKVHSVCSEDSRKTIIRWGIVARESESESLQEVLPPFQDINTNVTHPFAARSSSRVES
jgi:hypothetical protein